MDVIFEDLRWVLAKLRWKGTWSEQREGVLQRRKHHVSRSGEGRNSNTRMEDLHCCWCTEWEWKVKSIQWKTGKESRRRTILDPESLVLGLIWIREREREWTSSLSINLWNSASNQKVPSILHLILSNMRHQLQSLQNDDSKVVFSVYS